MTPPPPIRGLNWPLFTKWTITDPNGTHIVNGIHVENHWLDYSDCEPGRRVSSPEIMTHWLSCHVMNPILGNLSVFFSHSLTIMRPLVVRYIHENIATDRIKNAFLWTIMTICLDIKLQGASLDETFAHPDKHLTFKIWRLINCRRKRCQCISLTLQFEDEPWRSWSERYEVTFASLESIYFTTFSIAQKSPLSNPQVSSRL